MTLTLNTVNHFFCKTLWFMVLHNSIRFGDKMFCVQRILSGQTFTNIFPQDTLAYDAVPSNQVWLQTRLAV